MKTSYNNNNRSFEVWEEYFKPVQESDNEKIFPFAEDAWEYAKEKFNNEHPYRHIWSIVDSDDGEELILLNGLRRVNVLDYLVCETTWSSGENDTDYIEIDY